MNKTKEYWIKNIKDSDLGQLYCEEALKQMIGLQTIRRKYKDKKPLAGIKILGAGVITYECANFAALLHDLGADLRWVTDSLHYTIDSAAAYLVRKGIPVFGYRHMTEEDYTEAYHLAQFRDSKGEVIAPQYLISDGAEMPMFLAENYPAILPQITSIFEQTTCGINKYYTNFISEGKMSFRVMDINGCVTKSKFDNIYGSRESMLEGIQRSLNIQIAGTESIVFGYGEVGKGSAQALRGLGAHVSIVEIDPIMAMQAHMEGYLIEDKANALKKADIIVTATGCINTISEDDFKILNDNAVLMNMSEHNQEVDVRWIKSNKNIKGVKLNESATRYELNGKHFYILCDGYVLNLFAGYGHPPTVMGTTYTTHLLSILHVNSNKDNYKEYGIYQIPREVDELVAKYSFPEIEKKLSRLTDEQAKYLNVSCDGPYKRDEYKY
ncbi:adenosylhomocysteinase [Candidatus Dojkabacteria bacterium]|nr:adenosylhomocysteinase [Candidatus Dojkabacteria bacterium]